MSLPSKALQNESNDLAKLHHAIRDLSSADLSTVIRGLNVLTQKSCEAESVNFNLELYPQIIVSLGDLLDLVNPIASVLEVSPPPMIGELTSNPLCKDISWSKSIEPSSLQIMKTLGKVADENVLLLAILNILRNLSFDAANEHMIAASSTVFKHVVALEVVSGNTQGEATNFAHEIMCNIAPKVELSGRKRQHLQTFAWLEDCYTMDPRAKAMMETRISDQFSNASIHTYQRASEALLWHLCSSLDDVVDRSEVLRSLDLLSRLASSPDNAATFSRCPGSFLSKVVELLCVNSTSVDPSAICAQDGASRPPACLGPYFAEMNDTEVRDAALELMHWLCTSSSALQVRFGSVPHCVQILYSIVTSAKSHYERMTYVPRAEQPSQKASMILTILASKPQNATKFLTLRTEYCVGE